MKGTFHGGIRLDPRKRSTLSAVLEALDPPSLITVPLALREGTPATADVHPGDAVNIGTRLGVGEIPVYSPVSGRVRSVTEVPIPDGGSVPAVELENDGLDTSDPFVRPRGSLEALTPDEITELCYTAGLVLTGSPTPVYNRLRSLAGAPCEALIIDCTECDPFVTSRRRTLLDRTDEVLAGVRLFAKALSPKRTVLAVSSDSYDIAEHLTKRISRSDPMAVRVVSSKYPQGNERRLIEAVAGYQSADAVVLDPESAAELYRAASTGAPQLTRAVTVAGDAVANPKNLLVRIGTPLSALIDAAGGLSRDPAMLLFGGALTGAALDGADYPVTSSARAVLVLSEAAAAHTDSSACIRCGRCVAVCPENLEPLYISLWLTRGANYELRRSRVAQCIGCGSCSYVCPAKLPLAEHARLAKAKLLAARKTLVPPEANSESEVTE